MRVAVSHFRLYAFLRPRGICGDCLRPFGDSFDALSRKTSGVGSLHGDVQVAFALSIDADGAVNYLPLLQFGWRNEAPLPDFALSRRNFAAKLGPFEAEGLARVESRIDPQWNRAFVDELCLCHDSLRLVFVWGAGAVNLQIPVAA